MSEYVIATWPDGTRLVRPQFLSTDQYTMLFLVNEERCFLEIQVKKQGFTQLKSYAVLTKAQAGAAIWTLSSLLQIPAPKIWQSTEVPIPAVWPIERLILKLKRRLATAEDFPGPEHREDEWVSATDRFLKLIGLRWGPGLRSKHGAWLSNTRILTPSGAVPWGLSVWGDFEVHLHVPTIPQIEAGQGPSWSVHRKDGTYIEESDKDPYDALLKAGIVAIEADYDAWMSQRSLPGLVSHDMSIYQMLGLPLPILYSNKEFESWIEGLES